MKTKLLAMLLLLAVLAGFAACGGKSGGTTTTSPSTTAPGTSTPGTSEPTPPATTEDYGKTDPGLEAVNYDGETFDILQRTNYYGPMYEEWDIFEQQENVISQAVYDRNIYLEEKYNIDIEIVHEPRETIIREFSALADGDSNPYELVNAGIQYNQVLVMNGYIEAASNIPHLDFEKDYWHTEVMESVGFLNDYYVLSSDINIGLYHCVGTVFFNKQMMSDLEMDENYPYELVNTGAWTLDAMYELCQKAAKDNGDGIQDGNDTFGLVCTPAIAEIFFTGIGGTYAEKDEDDTPYITYNTPQNISYFEKIIDMIDDRVTNCLYTRYTNYVSPNNSNLFYDAFNQSRALFATDMIYQIDPLTNNDFIIGMLPPPKLNEEQSEYNTYIHYMHATSLAVPTQVDDLDMIGRVLEDGSYKSMELVRYAYYEQNLKARRAQDDESIEQIDIIYKNMIVDTGMALSAGGFGAPWKIREHLANGDSSVTSTLEGQLPNDQGIITSVLESLTELKNSKE